MNVLLDTHIWIWWATNPNRLSAQQRDLLDQCDAAVSAKSFWELTLLEAKGRIILDALGHKWIEHNLAVFPIQTL